ncbi:MAG: glycosyltransferase [Bacteroidales bacterium]|nr:glycosyltransferase [Candidatus Latescibacterota bacterium]
MYRILYTERASRIGGSNFSLLQLVKGLDRSRFSPFVLFKYDLPVRQNFRDAGIEEALWSSVTGGEEIQPPSTLRPYLPWYKKTDLYRLAWSIKHYMKVQKKEADDLVPWIREQGFDLVHTNNFVRADFPGLTAAHKAGIPAVSHQRGFYDLTCFQRFIARRVDRVLCVSRAVADYNVSQGLPSGRVMAIHNGIDLEAVRPSEALPVRSDGKKVVGYIGRLEEWKGVTSLIEAAEIVLSRRRDVRFVIAGTGPEEARLKKMIDSSPLLAGGVGLLGYSDDPLALIAECDVAVNTSIEPEPLGRSALEALASGVPVVASDSGGNPEIVEDGLNGFLYKTGDPASLADALERLLENDELRRKCSIGARRQAEKLFGADRYVHEVEAVYDEILAGIEPART